MFRSIINRIVISMFSSRRGRLRLFIIRVCACLVCMNRLLIMCARPMCIPIIIMCVVVLCRVFRITTVCAI